MFSTRASLRSTRETAKSDCARNIASTKTDSRSLKLSRSLLKVFIYVSGHGRVRAISRQTGDTEWEAKDLGLTPEMVLVGDVLYVRTGGQFTRLKDGETIERGSYGVSAIDVRNGKVLWRYKGADKGITNLLLPIETRSRSPIATI
jgi:outer membrane protein assembly factor BamB